MTSLVLVNGPPASGKSTIASRLVAVRPLALALDVDVVRALLGAWLDHPMDAGHAARRLALTMAGTHLASGHDVVVPQYLGRPEFIDELESAAAAASARFIEIGLVVDRQFAIANFRARSAAPETGAHRDAAALADRSTSSDPVGEMYDRYNELLELRPNTRRVPVVVGDIEATVAAVESMLH